MNRERNNYRQTQEQDNLLREGRNDDNDQSQFEQARQNLAEDNNREEEADVEQQHKDAMTERD